MDITPFVAMLMMLMGWIWTLRAGVEIQRYNSDRTRQRKRLAIGNTVVSTIPWAVAAFIVWPRS